MFTQSVLFCKNHIAVKPFCTFFGLDFQNQVERIKRDPVLNQLYGNFRTVGSDSKQREMFCLSKRGFVRWIDRINPQNVDEFLREKFIQYQILIDDYLYGSEEENQKIKIDYVRLKKLKRLYSLIGREIQRYESNVKLYMDARFCQMSLPLNDHNRQLES